MKTLNIPLEEKEYKELEKSKGGKTWREFILTLIKPLEEQNADSDDD